MLQDILAVFNTNQYYKPAGALHGAHWRRLVIQIFQWKTQASIMHTYIYLYTIYIYMNFLTMWSVSLEKSFSRRSDISRRDGFIAAGRILDFFSPYAPPWSDVCAQVTFN